MSAGRSIVRRIRARYERAHKDAYLSCLDLYRKWNPQLLTITPRPLAPLRNRPSRQAKRCERLDRGLVALKTDAGIFLSWRMLRSEDPIFGSARRPTVFTLVRDGVVLSELVGKTNYVDPEGTMASRYCVRTAAGESRTVQPLSSGKNYFDIPLRRPAAGPCGPYTINDVSVGDLDGDGAFELVVKWDSGGKDNSEPGLTGNVLLDAYRLDGERLWEQPIDLGPNIRAGAHYTQFLVYDFDQDGASELMLKTAPGSRDGNGRYVSQASRHAGIRGCDDTADFRDERGMVLDGDEFLTVFSGRDGAALDTIYYPNQRIDSTMWGDDTGNRSERYTAAVAWMDGVRPYGVFMRGYYWGKSDRLQARQCACAVSFKRGRLYCRHSFDTFSLEALGEMARSASFTERGAYKGVEGHRRFGSWYIGEGNHNCVVADVDKDGRDEVLTGALCYEFDALGRLGVRWCSFLGHGDALHLGAYDPGRRGYEFFTVHELSGTHPLTKAEMDHGMSVFDASTGKSLFHCPSPGDMGRGMMANVGAGGRYQFWGISEVEGSDERVLVGPFMYTGHAFERVDIPGVSCNFRIFWDGDLYDELLDGPSDGPLEVTSWNGSRMEPIFSTEGCVSINGTKANPCLQADLLGDWREELVMARADHEALRVFVSDIPTEYSLMTLMHDPVYRAGVAAEQTAYNLPPHLGFYLGPECFGKGGRPADDTIEGGHA